MQKDFHYYATYCASYLAGYSHDESLAIAYSAQFVDLCTKTYLAGIKAPSEAATTQLQSELADARLDTNGIHDITRIWASFHFLPRDLYADPGRKVSNKFLKKYQLICGPNSELLKETVMLARGRSLQAAGIAMHVLADTWAHQYFAGTPSFAINNTNDYFYEIVIREGDAIEVPVRFIHNPTKPDDIDNCIYTNSIRQGSENSVMNLGHGRAGHFPDYSYAVYKYMPSWGDYSEIVKNNPSDYLCAFTQMVCALKYLRGVYDSFEVGTYDREAIRPWKEEIFSILTKRRIDACEDWKALGEKISGCEIEDFELNKYRSEYMAAESDEAKDESFLGRFIIGAMAQKSMVTNQIFKSGNRLAGFSIDYEDEGFKGIKDYSALVRGMDAEADAKEASV